MGRREEGAGGQARGRPVGGDGGSPRNGSQGRMAGLRLSWLTMGRHARCYKTRGRLPPKIYIFLLKMLFLKKKIK